MANTKMSLSNTRDAREKAIIALERAKSMERKTNKEVHRLTLPNGTEITTTNKEHLNEYIKDYGSL